MALKSGPKIIHSLRYRDAKAAIDFLRHGFGFEENLVVPGEGESIAHAQLIGHGGMIMLGSEPHEGPFGKILKTPRALGGFVSASTYIVVDDPDAHYERAVAAGAEILMEIEDASYGCRGFSCRDLEGHVWSLGSYDPWAE